MTRRLLAAVLVMLSAATPVWAFSKAAEYLLAEELGKACGRAGGRVDTKGVEERDLTGDGKKDLIIDHHAFACAGGGISTECTHPAACNIFFYVREGALLRLVQDVFGVEAVVGGGDVPTIDVMDPQFRSRPLRWDGQRFADVR